jgi:3-methyl-2-oxobutanoate hydroxymethyltransferase
MSTAIPFADVTAGRITIQDLQTAKTKKQKWAMLTAYDAMTARIFDESGIPVLLVGDSAAMVVYGHDSTIPVTQAELIPLVQAVVRGSKRALVVADLPFGSYQESVEQALNTAVAFIKQGGAHAVKLEGGKSVLPQVAALVAAGIPVMGHLGLTPQSVNQFGGYKVQGRGDAGVQLIQDAIDLQSAGAFAIVLEVIPAELAGKVQAAVDIPVIGIGAGKNVDAQVLVWQDLLGLTPPPHPKFVTPYLDLRTQIASSIATWIQDVGSGNYPGVNHEYQ